jgi:hypothetical protein
MSGDYLLLMKVTHLHGNISKYTPDSSSTVRNNRRDFESLALDLSSSSVIEFNSFIVNFSPEDILSDLIGAKNQNSILTTEVSGISDNDCFAGDNISFW